MLMTSRFRIKDKNDLRKILKSLFLKVLNAKNEKECFKAFRNQWNYKENLYKGIFSDTFLIYLVNLSALSIFTPLFL